MALRPTVLETVQIGLETAHGTAVAANKRIQSLELDADPMIPSNMVEVAGWKAATDIVMNKEHTVLNGKGPVDFNALSFWLSSVLHDATITTPTKNGTYSVTFSGTDATGGDYTFTFNAVTSAAIAFGANAAAVQSALEAMSTIGTGNVLVTGSMAAGFTVVFRAALERTALALTGSGAGLTGPSSPYTMTLTSTAATAARRTIFLPSMTSTDTYKSYTVEKGSGSQAGSCAFANVTDLDIECNTKSADLKLQMIGQAWSDGITMTGTPTDIAVKAASTVLLDVYIGNTILGLTKLTECYKASWSMKDRRKMVQTLDSSFTSFTDMVEAKFNQACQMIVEENSTANSLMTDLRAGTTKFFRFVITGPAIETGYVYRLQVTCAVKLRNPKRGDHDGVYAGTLDLTPIYSASLGSSLEIVLDNIITALT